MPPRDVMIFAAGFGTRMGALTTDRPKPMLTLEGRSLLERALDLAADAGIERSIVNAHYHSTQIEDHLSGRVSHISIEKPDILDTGGGLKAALPHLSQSPIFAINPDGLWLGPNPFRVLAEAWRPDAMDALLLVCPLSKTVAHSGHGDFSIDYDGRLVRGGNHTYVSVQILRTEAVACFPERVFSLNRIWDQFAKGNRLFGVTYPGIWVDIGTPEGLEAARDRLRPRGA